VVEEKLEFDWQPAWTKERVRLAARVINMREERMRRSMIEESRSLNPLE